MWGNDENGFGIPGISILILVLLFSRSTKNYDPNLFDETLNNGRLADKI